MDSELVKIMVPFLWENVIMAPQNIGYEKKPDLEINTAYGAIRYRAWQTQSGHTQLYNKMGLQHPEKAWQALQSLGFFDMNNFAVLSQFNIFR